VSLQSWLTQPRPPTRTPRLAIANTMSRMRSRAPRPGSRPTPTRIVLLWVVVLVATAPLVAMSQVGAGDALHFLRSGLGPRVRAMGGTYAALTDDLTTVLWNPAGLVHTPGVRLGGGYESRFAGLVIVNHAVGAVSWGSFGGGLLWISSDLYSMYQLSAAARVLDSLALAGSCKLYQFGQGLQNASGVGFDISALYQWWQEEHEVTLGLNLRDIGWTAIRWSTQGVPAVDHAAWVARLGAALRLIGEDGVWIWSCDLEAALRRPPNPGEENYLANALQASLSLGTEVWLGPLALRAGMANIVTEEGLGEGTRPAVGIGLKWGSFNLDAAYVLTSPGYTYLLSLEVRFEGGN